VGEVEEEQVKKKQQKQNLGQKGEVKQKWEQPRQR
jgi:hypothetical protein